MAKSIIKTEEVKQVAVLSRLEFSESEIEKLKDDMSEIVSYFSSLSSVDTGSVSGINKPEGKLREDVVRESMTPNDVVKNAPHHNHNSFITPKVVD